MLHLEYLVSLLTSMFECPKYKGTLGWSNLENKGHNKGRAHACFSLLRFVRLPISLLSCYASQGLMFFSLPHNLHSLLYLRPSMARCRAIDIMHIERATPLDDSDPPPPSEWHRAPYLKGREDPFLKGV